MLIQIATNLHNDAIDCEKGNDQADRPGPTRVTAAGWVSAKTMRNFAASCFGMAFLLGIYLASQGGIPIVAIGIASLLAGWGYSGGPKPISYTPLGEIFVLIFFGLLAVWGCVWLQLVEPGWDTMVVGAICGLPAAAVLLVNNTRDLEADKRVGRKTLAAYLGPNRAQHAYRALLITPLLLLLPLVLQGHYWALLGFLAWPCTLTNIRHIKNAQSSVELGPLLPATARCGFILALLLTLGFALESL